MSKEMRISPYQYEGIQRCADIIETHIQNITTTLTKGIGRSCLSSHASNRPLLMNLSKELKELNNESINPSNKAYWLIRNYAKETIVDKQDVKELIDSPKVKNLVKSINKQTINSTLEQIKKIIDKRADNIKYAEKQIKICKSEEYLRRFKNKLKVKPINISKKIHIRNTIVGTDRTEKNSFTGEQDLVKSGYKRHARNKFILTERQLYVPMKIKVKIPYRFQATQFMDEVKQLESSYEDIKNSYRQIRRAVKPSLSPRKRYDNELDRFLFKFINRSKKLKASMNMTTLIPIKAKTQINTPRTSYLSKSHLVLSRQHHERVRKNRLCKRKLLY